MIETRIKKLKRRCRILSVAVIAAALLPLLMGAFAQDASFRILQCQDLQIMNGRNIVGRWTYDLRTHETRQSFYERDAMKLRVQTSVGKEEAKFFMSSDGPKSPVIEFKTDRKKKVGVMVLRDSKRRGRIMHLMDLETDTAELVVVEKNGDKKRLP